MPVKPPIDGAQPGKTVLAGRIVTMDAAGSVVDGGRLYIKDGAVVAAQPASAPPPAGFEDVAAVETRGTIFPGLIELHNHLPYNVLQLWGVPKKYSNRDQWSAAKDYGTMISGPMRILGSSPELMPAVVRYVEVKALLGGVTTTQGIALFSNSGARRYYRGLVRNVEATADPDLPDAITRVADVDASDASSFRTRLKKSSCLLLHLAEGTNAAAYRHFEALRLPGDEWAVEPSLSGIHCVALKRADFDVLADRGASMVWSPFSNLLLYGDTADLSAAVAAGVSIGIGSDWAPSGSKNLLAELKVALLESQRRGWSLSARDLVALATSSAAKILRWDRRLGSLEPGKMADLVVVEGASGDPYEALLRSRETSLVLVMINGIARVGTPGLMKSLGVTGESIKVGGHTRRLNLAQATADPDVTKLRLADAIDLLSKALQNLPNVAQKMKRAARPGTSWQRANLMDRPPQWFLALDELEDTGYDMRPRLRLAGRPTGPDTRHEGNLAPRQLPALTLDALTMVDDATFLDRLAVEQVLPSEIAAGLRTFY
jgi:cytosine/adenosine deaminase-related metal-dependent hydrolase